MTAIIGHDQILQELERIASLDDVPQSYLFFGPRHIGKRLVAEWFAHILIGSEDVRTDADLLVLEPPQESGETKVKREKAISIDMIREAKRFLGRSPSSGKQRVLIIDRAEKLNAAASNALLKILEEPPKRSIIILITAEPAHLPVTVRSRVLTLMFRPVAPTVLRQAYSNLGDLPQFFFDLGLPGILHLAQENVEEFVAYKEVLRELFQLSKISLRKRIALAESLSKNEQYTEDILTILAIGLAFQSRQRDGDDIREKYLFIEKILSSLTALSRSEGASRPIMEKLFLSPT